MVFDLAMMRTVKVYPDAVFLYHVCSPWGLTVFLLYASPVGCKSMSQIDVDDNWEVGFCCNLNAANACSCGGMKLCKHLNVGNVTIFRKSMLAFLFLDQEER